MFVAPFPRSAASALLSLLLGQPVEAGATCASEGSTPIAVTTVQPRLQLSLSDGRMLRLAGVEPSGSTPADPDLGETGRAALAAALDGHALSATILADRPDRWGRWPAMVFLDGGGVAAGVNAAALRSGLGRYWPEAGAHLCRDALLVAEDEARKAALGLWHDPYYGVLAVDDRDAFAERAATFVVAKGVLRRVEAGPFRTKLRLATSASGHIGPLVAVVLPKVVKRFEDQGVQFGALIGRTIRLRGLLDLRFGPQIEIAGPDALEIEPASSPASADGAVAAARP